MAQLLFEAAPPAEMQALGLGSCCSPAPIAGPAIARVTRRATGARSRLTIDQRCGAPSMCAALKPSDDALRFGSACHPPPSGDRRLGALEPGDLVARAGGDVGEAPVGRK